MHAASFQVIMQPVVAGKPPKGTGRPTTEQDGGNKSTVHLIKDSAPATQQEVSNKSPVQLATTSGQLLKVK